MQCEKCEGTIPEEEVFRHGGKNYCEDCFVELRSVPKTCDPMAVRSARLTREIMGQGGENGLLPLQRQIYQHVKEAGKAKREEITQKFDLSQEELEKHVAVLRHCELIRATKVDGEVYITTFDNE